MSQLDVNRQALIEDCLVEMEIGSRRVTLMNAAARQELGYAGVDGDLSAVDLIYPDYFDIIQQVHLRYAGESIANRTPYQRVMSQETFEWVLRRGYWVQIESYVRKHSDADFQHGLCDSCREELYGDSPAEG